MKFNPIKRGNKRESNTEEQLYEVLDANYIATLAINGEKGPKMIPMAYGRDGDTIYIHGSSKNYILNKALEIPKVCLSVHCTDGLVLAQTLFNTGLNYRSVVLFGAMQLVSDEQERIQGLKCITQHIIPGRWDEVELGSPEQQKATLVVKMKIEEASVKIRQGGPTGDEDLNKEVWSGHIPLKQIALPPIYDEKRLQKFKEDESVEFFYLKNKL